MVEYYAQRASEYERIYHKPERQADLQVLRSFVENAFRGADVLEVACGTGYWTEILARTATTVLATDINEEVLEIARSRCVDARTVTFRREDAHTLPFLPRKFTAGLAAFWWSHMPKNQIRPFLEGLHRLLAPNATVVFIDNNYVEGSSTPISRTDQHGNTYQMRTLDDGSAHEVRKNFPSGSELRAAVKGLARNVQVKLLKYYWILSYVTPAVSPAK